MGSQDHHGIARSMTMVTLLCNSLPMMRIVRYRLSVKYEYWGEMLVLVEFCVRIKAKLKEIFDSFLAQTLQ